MLKFYYDFLLKFLSLDSFALIQMDTDSIYLALSKKTLYLAVKSDMRNEFEQKHTSWMCREYCDEHKLQYFQCMFNGQTWNPLDCCKASAKLTTKDLWGCFTAKMSPEVL